MRTLALASMAALCFLTGLSAAYAQTIERYAEQKDMIVGGRVAAIGVQDVNGPVMSVGAFTDMPLTEKVLVGISFDYWRETAGLVSPRTSISDIALAGNAKYIFTRVYSDLRPYVGAGAALHRIVDEVDRSNGQSAGMGYSTEQSVALNPGIDLMGGVFYSLQRHLDVFSDVKYRSVFRNNPRVDNLGVAAGLNYRM